MADEGVDEIVIVCLGARTQSLLEARELGGRAIRVADVRCLNKVNPLVFGGDVAEVGDGGDVVRVDARVSGLLPESFVYLHVVPEVAAYVRADTGDEG